MSIHLCRDLEDRIRAKVRDGSYSTEEDVVEAALILLDAKDLIDGRELERLRDAIDASLADVEQERFVSLDEVMADTEAILARHGG